MEKLRALDVWRLPAGKWPDGKGLYLAVTGPEARSWIYRYVLRGRERYLGLGPANAISLKRARELAAEARRLRAEGIDPVEQRRKQRSALLVEQSKSVTFREAAEAYIGMHEVAWKNPKHRAQWRSTLSAYAYPVIGHLPVSAVDTSLVLKVLEPVWLSKPETASRLRGRVESILDAAKSRGSPHR